MKPFRVGPLQRPDLLGRESFPFNLLVPSWVAVETKLQKRIETKIVLGPRAAKIGDLGQLMEIGAQSHSL